MLYLTLLKLLVLVLLCLWLNIRIRHKMSSNSQQDESSVDTNPAKPQYKKAAVHPVLKEQK